MHQLRALSRGTAAIVSDAIAAKMNVTRPSTDNNTVSSPSNDGGDSLLDDDVNDDNLMGEPWWTKIHEESGRHSFNFIPGSRRASSSVVYAYESPARSLLASHNQTSPEHASAAKADIDPSRTTIEEYMIISGGYTYVDWRTFPVYAFPLTSAEQTRSGEWIDLSPPAAFNEDVSCRMEDDAQARDRLFRDVQFVDNDEGDASDVDDPWEHAAPCGPTGRMGHLSGIYNHKIYVFGGLVYDEELEAETYGRSRSRGRETFRLEDVPYIYRLDLREMLDRRREENDGGEEKVYSTSSVTGWQRILPRVKRPVAGVESSSSSMVLPNSAGEVLLSYINRGEMQGGHWMGETNDGHDRLVMYGGLRISGGGGGTHHHSDHPIDTPAFSSSAAVSSSHRIVEAPLGDVWAYDYVLHCWERISGDEGVDDKWQSSMYPRPRTAHAATVVESQLVIHGGMGIGEYTDEMGLGVTDWETLDDMWVIDLNTRTWRRRWLSPPLVRSYHSLVGWSTYTCDSNIVATGSKCFFDNCTRHTDPVVAAFGGYTLGLDLLSGVEAAYVFDDLLVAYPDGYGYDVELRFKELAHDIRGYYDGYKYTHPTVEEFQGTPYDLVYVDAPPTPWLKASGHGLEGNEMIQTRYQHSAVISKEGVLTVWGGEFENTAEITGLWMINIAGKESTVNLEMAEEDAFDFEGTITAMHTIIIMLMFMSISLTLLLGISQRYQDFVAQVNNDTAVAQDFNVAAAQDFSVMAPTRRGSGLHPEIIDTIPRKIYNARDDAATEEGENCCPICLVNYSDGDELRVLPCGHYLHRFCLDAWLASNPSCPSCRYSLRELVDDRPMLQLRTLRSRLSNLNVRFIGHDYRDGIEMSDASLPRGSVIGIPIYISEVEATESRVEVHQESGVADDTDQRSHTAIDDIRDWRSRRGQRQRGRRLPSFRVRSSQRRSRVPEVDMDEYG